MSQTKTNTKIRADERSRKFLRYFDRNQAAGETMRRWLAAGCDLQTLVTYLHSCLSREYLYEERRKRRDRTEARLKMAIKGLGAAAEFYRFGNQQTDAARMEAEKRRLEGYWDRVEKSGAFDTKRLGALHGKLPVALFPLARVEDYIAGKTGARPAPRETAWLVEAILGAFDKLPTAGVDTDLLAKKLRAFRERNPNLERIIATYPF